MHSARVRARTRLLLGRRGEATVTVLVAELGDLRVWAITNLRASIMP